MVVLDIVQLVFEFLKIHFFENFLIRTQGFVRFMSWVKNFPFMDIIIHKYNSANDYFFTDGIGKIVTIIPEKFLVGIREFFVCYRLLFDLRILVGWAPINTWNGILSLITEPVDMLLRPLYFLPKVYYIDVPFLLISTGFDNIISLVDFLIAVAKES